MIKLKSNYWDNENFQIGGRSLIENKMKNLKESNEEGKKRKKRNKKKGIRKII